MKLVIKNNKQKFHPITNKGIWELQAHIQNFMGTSRHMHNNFEKKKQNSGIMKMGFTGTIFRAREHRFLLSTCLKKMVSI